VTSLLKYNSKLGRIAPVKAVVILDVTGKISKYIFCKNGFKKALMKSSILSLGLVNGLLFTRIDPFLKKRRKKCERKSEFAGTVKGLENGTQI